jgi:competence protein ComEA
MNLNKIIKVVTICVFLLLFGGGYVLSHRGTENTLMKQKEQKVVITQNDEKDTDKKAETLEVSSIHVHVCGAVKKPGVYELSVDARICDAISAAGGLKKKAADSDINQAQLLSDGEQVCIPYKTAKKQDTITETSSDTTKQSKINLNTATSEELQTLPGIGVSKADSILQYRQENGKFSSIEEIKNITGIKDGVYSKIEAYITV